MRKKLPTRRASTNEDFIHNGMEYTMTIGEYEDGKPGEVFVSAKKCDTAVDHIAKDCSVILSHSLQHGIDMNLIAKSMMADENQEPASVAGVAVRKLVELSAT